MTQTAALNDKTEAYLCGLGASPGRNGSITCSKGPHVKCNCCLGLSSSAEAAVACFSRKYQSQSVQMLVQFLACFAFKRCYSQNKTIMGENIYGIIFTTRIFDRQTLPSSTTLHLFTAPKKFSGTDTISLYQPSTLYPQASWELPCI